MPGWSAWKPDDVDYRGSRRGMACPATGKRGVNRVYSAIAIETSLALRLVFHQPLCQTEGLLRSIADVLGINIAIPDHTTLSRRGGGLTVCRSKSIARSHCICWSIAPG